ncbi:MAG: FHA domain-containing protein [Gammaproteobacteria bacterium]|nr:FHA domain-containing protein [Gammaproteobacteria bacterium]
MARLILNLDGQQLAEYNMSKERYTIGRLPDNDVRIDNPTVSGHHSLIINILNDSFLEDLNSTNGTYVNGKLIKKHALQHGDVITVGRHQLRFVDSNAADDEQDEFSRTMVIENADMVKDHAPAEAQAAMAEAQAEAAAAVAAPSAAEQRMMDTAAGSKPLPIAKIQVLNGNFAGREVSLAKAVTTLGRPGVQVVAITRRSDGYHVVQVENADGREPAKLNGETLGAQAKELRDNDVVEIIGIKMGFFAD